MKRHFTLIEMLVVVAVIAILIGILIPTVGTVMEKVKINKAKATLNSLRIGIKQYETTYGILPYTGSGTDKQLTDEEYTALLTMLSGDNTIGNAREIKFLDLTESDYSDPWGNNFRVSLDLSYDDEICGSNIAGVTDGAPLGTSLVIWSMGADGVESVDEGNNADNEDNVESWNN